MRAMTMLIAVFVVVAGCASTSNVLPLGPDTFRVAASRDNWRGGAPAAQEAALLTAQQHCININKEFVVTNTSIYISTFTVTFRCLNKGDPELKRPDIQ